MGVGPHWYTKCPPKAKVGYFDGSFLVNEEVLGFKVTVNHTTCVHEHNPLQNLVSVALEEQ